MYQETDIYMYTCTINRDKFVHSWTTSSFINQFEQRETTLHTRLYLVDLI